MATATVRVDGESGHVRVVLHPRGAARAWVTLLSTDSYLRGAQCLARALRATGTHFPLVAIVTGGVSDASARALQEEGCLVRREPAVRLPAAAERRANYACAHFADCWTKLRLWGWGADYTQLCYLDADMLPLANMDELLEVDVPAQAALLAVPECACRRASMRARCPYAHAAHDGARRWYFNAGLLVLRPSEREHARLMALLGSFDPARAASLPFAEQDWLNMVYGYVHTAHGGGGAAGGAAVHAPPGDGGGSWGAEADTSGTAMAPDGGPDEHPRAWLPLPWAFNATKAIYAHHRARAPSAAGQGAPAAGGAHPPGAAEGRSAQTGVVFELEAARNLHFTMAKPWNLRDRHNRGYGRINRLWWRALLRGRPSANGRRGGGGLTAVCAVLAMRAKAAGARAPESGRAARADGADDESESDSSSSDGSAESGEGPLPARRGAERGSGAGLADGAAPNAAEARDGAAAAAAEWEASDAWCVRAGLPAALLRAARAPMPASCSGEHGGAARLAMRQHLTDLVLLADAAGTRPVAYLPAS